MDIFTDSIQFLFVSDDAIVIIPLPYRMTGEVTMFVDSFGDGGFETSNKGAEGFWFRPAGWIFVCL